MQAAQKRSGWFGRFSSNALHRWKGKGPLHHDHLRLHRLLSSRPAMAFFSTTATNRGHLRTLDHLLAKHQRLDGRRAADIKVIVAMSGGVDSTVSALLLKRKGFNVKALFMKNWDRQEEREGGECEADRDYAEVRRLCARLEVPLLGRVELVREYWMEVFMPLVESVREGHTLNPDSLCNMEIKFKHFVNHCLERWKDVDYIATGHYARIFEEDDEGGKNGRVQLWRGVDECKDQTFWLMGVPQAALRRMIFPVGEMTKEQVRSIAQKEGFDHQATKKSSSGICFIGRRDFPTFIQQYLDTKPGPFRDIDSNDILGQHDGFCLYTIGQGARVPGCAQKMYVVAKDKESNTVYLGGGQRHPSLYVNRFDVDKVHWIAGEAPKILEEQKFINCQYRIRNTQELSSCTLIPLSSLPNSSTTADPSPSSSSFQVQLERPKRAVTMQQSVAFYDGQACLGGGFISQVGPSFWDMRLPLPTHVVR
ncbi:tRNA-specific 2-thiouridylase MnmA [Balamuthia mandrillaris]